MIRFTVYGAPVSQPRQRHRVMVKNGKAFATNYTPAKDPVQSWKSYVRDAAEKAGAVVFTGPVRMSIWFYLPRPQSLSRKKDPDGPVIHAGAKDLDNLYKAVADSLIGICFQDDRQVAEAKICKFYHEKAGAPRAMIEIAPLTLERTNGL
jgi:Holliday junction resolvase RusA-like endonuclease